eukprot:gene1390-1411_t
MADPKDLDGVSGPVPQRRGIPVFLQGTGDLRRLIAAFDWSRTTLGPLEHWPQSLRSTVGLVIASPVAMVLLWGEDGVMIYNDAYSSFAGGRHPKLLGSKVREGWPEVATFNDNVMRVGLAGGTLAYRDQELVLYRNGGPENVWMDLTYSPVPDETGRPAGVIAIVIETTERVQADRRLAAERHRLQKLFEQAPGFMAMFEGPQHICTLSNAAHARLVGYRDMVGLRLRDAVPEVEGQDYFELMERCYRTGQSFVGTGMKVNLRTAPYGVAEDRYIDFVYQPVRAEDGEVTGIFLEGSDVTERVLGEAALRESELRFRQLAESIDDVFYVTDLENRRLLYLSPAFETIWQRPVSWMMQEQNRLDDTVHPGDLMDLRASREAQRRGEATQVEYRILRPDGELRWISDSSFPVQGWAGRRAAGLAEDITERRKTDAALRESEARFREVADAAPVLIWMSDTTQKATWFNVAWLSFTGRSLEQETGSGWLDSVADEDRQRCVATYASAFGRREPFRMDYRLRRADGQMRAIDDNGVPRFAPDGTFLGYIGSGVDVTDARQAAAELLTLTEQLEARVDERTAELAAVNRQLVAQIEERERVEATLRQMQRLEAVGQLTAGVAHDFNNLLMVVLGNIRFLERQVSQLEHSARLRDRLDIMRGAAERGAKLTTQLLAFSRRQLLEAREVDLNDTVMRMHELLISSMSGVAQLETKLHPAVWPAMVDPTQIELVILNLAINGRDAMQVGGRLLVETDNVQLGAPRRPEEPAAGDYVMVSVADTGTGMTPEVLARAFEPFFTTKPVGKGSGLGLAQVFGFAKQSGGGVSISTAPGQGTVVRVYLPRATHLPGMDATLPVPAGERALPQGCRVLVVDDDPAVRLVTASMLRDLGCEVADAESGAAALELLAREQFAPDLMVVDFAMPAMNGLELAREVARSLPRLPILFATGYADLASMAAMSEDAILQKPFDEHALRRKIGRLLMLGTA